MSENSINEIYQLRLRAKFLWKLEKMQPKILRETKEKIYPAYVEACKAEQDPNDVNDALTDPENYSDNIQIFIRKFCSWLDSWKINVDWISNEFMSLLLSWKENHHHLSNGHLYDCLEMNYVPSFETEFEFKFRSLNRDEKLTNYREAVTDEFKEQINKYLAEMESQYSVIPITKNKELQHIEWLIDYHFNPKKTYGDIATKMQLESKKTKFSNETIRKAVTELADKLPFPLKS